MSKINNKAVLKIFKAIRKTLEFFELDKKYNLINKIFNVVRKDANLNLNLLKLFFLQM